MKDYNIKENDTLKVVVKLRPIKFKIFDTKSISLDVDLSDSIENVKKINLQNRKYFTRTPNIDFCK